MAVHRHATRFGGAHFVQGFVHFGHDVKAVEDVQRLGTFFANDFQVGLPHIGADEHNLGSQFVADDGEKSPEGFDGSFAAHPKQARDVEIDLINQSQVLVAFGIALPGRAGALRSCRPAVPRSRSGSEGKVESSVGHGWPKNPVERASLRNARKRLRSIIDHWEERWANTRIHGTTKRQVAVMFAEERPALLTLPVVPFRYYQYGERSVHLDGCVEVEAAYYSAPPGWIGRRVSVQSESRQVRLLDPENRSATA